MQNINLLSSTSRVETPFIKVKIGDYTFGVYGKQTDTVNHKNILEFPNYVQKLEVQKINGKVNTYNLTLNYVITESNDPNFFEKVFSSVSKTRKMVLTYGDLSSPTFTYKDEETIITDVKEQFNIANSSIQYTVTAISNAVLATVGTYNFAAKIAKPSDEIIRILYDNTFGLQDIFYGMRNKDLVLMKGLIKSDDVKVKIEAKTNISILDYLSYLVSCMTSVETIGSISNLIGSIGNAISNSLIANTNDLIKKDFYVLQIVDDTSGEFGGPYFKIDKVSKQISNSLETYQIDIGYPSQNIVTNFNIDNNQSFAIFYDFNQKLNKEEYVQRINDEGNIEYMYAPVIASNNNHFITTETEKTWWTKITQYPLSCNITFKGLLRPAVLMTHVKLNVLFYGRKHISSGLYVITKQVDTVDAQGFRTQLSLTRISGDEDII